MANEDQEGRHASSWSPARTRASRARSSRPTPRRQRVLVEGVNRIKKHTKVGQSTRGAKTGGIVTQEAPVHVSNVMLLVEVDGKKVGSRIGYRVEKVERDGRERTVRVRYAKRTGEDI